ncbi:MAG: glycosyltransferase family 4 protein [Verrucomicrobia bacterium]|nr:glycosyltransferase family 4 protein [Verrucomicrobiota bacterium]
MDTFAAPLMKVLFDHPMPFALAHGGFQTQIEQTRAALAPLGVEVEWLRWWDTAQHGDLIHCFGTASVAYLQQARAMRVPVVMTTLFTETCNRSDARLAWQGRMVRTILKLPFGEGMKNHLPWRAFSSCARNVVGLEVEKKVLQLVYGVEDAAVSVVPLGLSEAFLRAGPGSRNEPHLVCTGTITPRKRTVELAELARAARVPILFVGKPYHESDPYWQRFRELVDGQFVKHHPHVTGETEMIELLRAARGFVLMSAYENWCLSAHEAAACGLPLLVPDQKWSRERFGGEARYFTGDAARDDAVLKKFHDACPKLPAPRVKLFSWLDAARQLKAVYEDVLKASL